MGTDAGPMMDAGPITPMIEIGTGELEFETITEGQDLFFILGPQGGFHFLASVYVQGIEGGNPDDRSDPRNPVTEFRVFRDSGERVDLMASRYEQGLDPVMGRPGHEMVGRLLILGIGDVADLDGDSVRVSVTVSDVDGVMLTDERTVRAVSHPRN